MNNQIKNTKKKLHKNYLYDGQFLFENKIVTFEKL